VELNVVIVWGGGAGGEKNAIGRKKDPSGKDASIKIKGMVILIGRETVGKRSSIEGRKNKNRISCDRFRKKTKRKQSEWVHTSVTGCGTENAPLFCNMSGIGPLVGAAEK